jgi:hypothetical protein
MSQPVSPLPSQEDFARMERRLLESVAASEKKRTFRMRLFTGCAAVLLVGASAAAWVTETAPAHVAATAAQPTMAYCYEGAGNSSPRVRVDTPKDRPQDPSVLAVQLCAAKWSEGAIGNQETTTAADSGGKDPVPELQACVRPDRVIAVFPRAPGDQVSAKAFCTRNGMVPPAGQ